MDFSNQLLFFFSALGVFNGLLLTVFLWKVEPKSLANRFLSLMLLMICLRIGKSVFFYFQSDLALTYLQIGLSACFLIGPFLYFFIAASFEKLNRKHSQIHIVLLITLILAIGLSFPYQAYPDLWRGIIFRTVNLTWLIYLVLAWYLALFAIKDKKSNSNANDSNLTKTSIQDKTTFNTARKAVKDYPLEISVLAGNSLIWLAYYTSSFTSYIAGALSFSFITYLTLIIYFRQRDLKGDPKSDSEKSDVNQKDWAQKNRTQKYADKQLDEDTVETLVTGLTQLMQEQKLYKDANLTLPKIAKKLGTNVPVLSQLLNDNLNIPFSQFINEHRIEEAKQLLLENINQSMEVIAEQCGFNSQSTFYTAFKKHAHTTPAKYRGDRLSLQSEPPKSHSS